MKPERKIVATSDGSRTLYLPDWDESYHSRHGAVQEALHVFIETGLRHSELDPVRVFELGFGTGLNALLTAWEARAAGRGISYCTIEAFPCTWEEASAMEYPSHLAVKDMPPELLEDWMKTMHEAPWGEPVPIHKGFELEKVRASIADWAPGSQFDLVYYDAFGPRVQPELWEKEILAKVTGAMAKGGIFVTYSAKGSVRRVLQGLGLEVERLPGPPGKREMLRGRKP